MMTDATKPDRDAYLNQLELLTEAAVATTAEAQILRHDVKKERRKDSVLRAMVMAVLVIQLFALWSFNQSQRERAAEAYSQRESLQNTTELIRDCVDLKRVSSPCQKQSRKRSAEAYKTIQQQNRDLLITAFQCARDPQSVDNAALEECIVSQAGQVRTEN